MVENVKLEIAIQLVAEKIADLYYKIENSSSLSERQALEENLALAFDEKEKVALGDHVVIEKIISERSGKNGR